MQDSWWRASCQPGVGGWLMRPPPDTPTGHSTTVHSDKAIVTHISLLILGSDENRVCHIEGHAQNSAIAAPAWLGAAAQWRMHTQKARGLVFCFPSSHAHQTTTLGSCSTAWQSLTICVSS